MAPAWCDGCCPAVSRVCDLVVSSRHSGVCALQLYVRVDFSTRTRICGAKTVFHLASAESLQIDSFWNFYLDSYQCDDDDYWQQPRTPIWLGRPQPRRVFQTCVAASRGRAAATFVPPRRSACSRSLRPGLKPLRHGATRQMVREGTNLHCAINSRRVHTVGDLCMHDRAGEGEECPMPSEESQCLFPPLARPI